MGSANRVFYNGHIRTMKNEKSICEAIAIKDGKIVAVGSTSDLLSQEHEEAIDLSGKTVIPGFSDSHIHIHMDCLSRSKINLSKVTSIPQLCSILRAAISSIPSGGWMVSESLHMDYLEEKRFPTNKELDTISQDIPVGVISFCRHAIVLNSKALSICGITKDFVESIAGTVDRYPSGEPNGTIREDTFYDHVTPHIPAPNLEESIKMMEDYLQYSASMGITTLHGYQGEEQDGFRLYQEIEKRKNLRCRILISPVMQVPQELGFVTGFGSETIKFAAAKYLTDGSIGAASARMYEDYCDRPGERGIQVYTQEELNKVVLDAYNAGLDVAVHAIGDESNDMTMQAFENAYRPEIGWKRRFYLIHGTVTTSGFLERAKKLPLLISTQPVFLENYNGVVKERLGEDRMKRLMPIKTWMREGLIVSCSSDAPVCNPDPLRGIYCAVTRQGSRNISEPMNGSEAINIYQAVEAYTKNAAYFGQEENIKGTLEIGKLADFVVLDRDIFEIEYEDIPNIKVLRTVMDGKDTFLN